MRKMLVLLVALIMALTGAAVTLGCSDAQSVVKDARLAAPTTVPAVSYTNSNYGIDFKADKYAQYDTTKKVATPPKTISAKIRIPKGAANRTGIILGCYKANQNEYNFEIQSTGSGDSLVRFPKVFHVGNGSASQYSFEFKNVDLAEDTDYMLTVVHDTQNAEAHCYVNGVLKQTLTVTDTSKYSTYVKNGEYAYTLDKTLRVGGDYRDIGKTGENACNFKGWIRSIEAYSDVRTATEIAADYARKADDYFYDDDLMLAYDFTQPGEDFLKDLSGNGYDLAATKAAYASDMQGMAFGRFDNYIMDNKVAEIPNTVEAYIYLPENYASRGGIIASNYLNGSSTCFSFEIHEKGMPKLYYDYANYAVTNVNFTGVNVALGRWVHVAIAHDTKAKTVTLYLDGEETMKLENVLPGDTAAHNDPAYAAFEYEIDKPLMIGGDYRDPGKNIENLQYFKGLIHSVAMYSDVRTPAEIKADMAGADVNDNNLLAYYELSGHNGMDTIYDLSKNKNNIGAWITPAEAGDPGEYDYSFAVVGDTQIVAERYPEKMADIYDFIVDQADDMKIAHAFGLGDITNSDTAAEWATAQSAISKMDGKVPYSLVRGNHDSSTGMQVFNYDAYTSQFNGFYEAGKLENSYKTFTAGNDKYLLITLDYGASDDVLAWAGELCEQFADHKVIVTTHAYLFRDGTTLDQNDVCPPATTGGSNNGDHMWDKFIKNYGNIFLVLSGHDPCDDVVTTKTKGIHGNTVTQMLIDPQGVDVKEGATGMVAMLFVSGDKITVRYISTVREECYKASNQYAIALADYEYNAHTYENRQVDANLVSGATSTSHAVYYKSCVCGERGTETFEYCDGNHIFNEKISTDTYKAGSQGPGAHARYYYSCICGAKGTKTYEVCDNVNHVYKEKVADAAFLNSEATESAHATYFYSCICGSKGSETFERCNGNHIFVNNADAAFIKSAANCIEYAQYYKSCVCGEASEETFEYVEGGFTDDHVYDRKVVSNQYLVSGATCTDKPVYNYSCVCGERGNETFAYGKVLPHEFDNQIEDEKFLAAKVTCLSKAKYYYSCDCGAMGEATFESGEIDANAHVFEKKIFAEYVVTEATCTSKAQYAYVCACGERSKETYEYGNVAPHAFDNAVVENKYLASNATCLSKAKYYYSCECGAIGDETFENGNASGVHAFNKAVAEDEYLASNATCLSKATYYYSCECGEKGTETFESGELSTVHNFNKAVAEDKYLASNATCSAKAKYYYSCECGAVGTTTFEDGELAAHNYEFKVANDKYLASSATCTNKATYYYSCKCGEMGKAVFTYGTTKPHAYNAPIARCDVATLATCVSQATYYYTCECGAKNGKTFAYGELADHEYDRKVTTKAYRVSVADCDSAAVYNYSCVCGAKGTETFESGVALGHKYADGHLCHDRKCISCDYVKEATTEHVWDGGVVIRPATDAATGEKVYTCTECKEKKTEEIDNSNADGSCATVAPVGFGGFGGGTALMLLSFAAIVAILMKRRTSVK